MLVDLNTFAPSSSRGFIVLEGVNGAGKSTLQTRLADFLNERGKTVLQTRQPGGTSLGKRIRELLLAEESDKSPLAELFLFAADRAEHVSKTILPALNGGSVVLCDRYLYSTTAFQGYGRKLDLNLVSQVNSLAVQGITPDLVILLDLEPEEGLRRTKGRDEQDNFEAEELAFHHRLRDGFLTIAEESSEPFLVVDAALSAEKVFEQAKLALEKLLSAPCSAA